MFVEYKVVIKIQLPAIDLTKSVKLIYVSFHLNSFSQCVDNAVCDLILPFVI